MILLAFYGFYILDQGMSGTEALSASFNLVKDNFGRVFLVLLVAFLINLRRRAALRHRPPRDRADLLDHRCVRLPQAEQPARSPRSATRRMASSECVFCGIVAGRGRRLRSCSRNPRSSGSSTAGRCSRVTSSSCRARTSSPSPISRVELIEPVFGAAQRCAAAMPEALGATGLVGEPEQRRQPVGTAPACPCGAAHQGRRAARLLLAAHHATPTKPRWRPMRLASARALQA